MSLPNPPPIVSGTLRVGPLAPHSTQRSTWQLEEVLVDLVDELRTSHRDDVNDVEIDIHAQFAGSPPALSLSAAMLKTLALNRAALSVELEPIELNAALRAIRSSRVGHVATTVRVAFRIRGHFDPDLFSQRVQIRPTSVVREDESRPARARMSVWRIETGPTESARFPVAVFRPLLSVLIRHRAAIARAARELHVDPALRFTAECNDVIPRLDLSAELIGEISTLDCRLEFAVTLAREDDETFEF